MAQGEINAQMDVKKMRITPEIAADMLSRNVRNRPINKNSVKNYAAQMDRGEWQLTPQGISFNTHHELLDGQHRLHAVIKADRPVEMMVFENVEDSNFKVLDTGTNRNGGHVLAMEGVKYHNEVASGIRKYWVLSNTREQNIGKYPKISTTQILDIYLSHKTLCGELTLYSIEKYKIAPYYPKSELIGVMMYLHLDLGHSISLIHGFFNQLIEGRLIKDNSIDLLRQLLVRDAFRKTQGLTRKDKLILLKRAWNSYITGKKIDSLDHTLEKGERVEFL